MKFTLFLWTIVGMIFFTIDFFSMKRNFSLVLDGSMVIIYILALIQDLFKTGETICPYNETKF